MTTNKTEKTEKTLRILSIDAQASIESWVWNDWRDVGQISADSINWSTESIIKWFQDNNYLSEKATNRVIIDDDGYNLVLIDSHNSEPLLAIEYGNLDL